MIRAAFETIPLVENEISQHAENSTMPMIEGMPQRDAQPDCIKKKALINGPKTNAHLPITVPESCAPRIAVAITPEMNTNTVSAVTDFLIETSMRMTPNV